MAGLPDATTARVDLDAGPLESALLWAASTAIRRRARRAGAGYRYLFMHPSGADLGVLADLVDRGELRPVADRTYPFADIAEAFAYLEQARAKGKVSWSSSRTDVRRAARRGRDRPRRCRRRWRARGRRRRTAAR